MKPIKPEEIDLIAKLPEEVITSFNKLIVENYNGKTSEFRAEDVANLI